MSAKKKVKPEKRFSASNPEKTMDPERMKLFEEIREIRRAIGPVSTNAGDILRELGERSE